MNTLNPTNITRDLDSNVSLTRYRLSNELHGRDEGLFFIQIAIAIDHIKTDSNYILISKVVQTSNEVHDKGSVVFEPGIITEDDAV